MIYIIDLSKNSCLAVADRSERGSVKIFSYLPGEPQRHAFFFVLSGLCSEPEHFLFFLLKQAALQSGMPERKEQMLSSDEEVFGEVCFVCMFSFFFFLFLSSFSFLLLSFPSFSHIQEASDIKCINTVKFEELGVELFVEVPSNLNSSVICTDMSYHVQLL